jgi:hypothetical protein
MRTSTTALSLLAVLAAALGTCLVDARLASGSRAEEVAGMRALTARLGLTDLALFTEARYTRHPSQADLHSALQDHPLALEHFPSGSLIPPRHASLARETASPD